MKPYQRLTFPGRLRRLRDLAVTALTHYDLNNPQLVYHGFFTNLLYRVTTASGECFMLRLAAPGWRTFEDLQSEAIWLDALRRDTSIAAPIVILSQTGDCVLPLSASGVSGVWNTTLMSWLPGSLLGNYLTQFNLEKMGALFAALHLHGTEWLPPAGFTPRRFEHWLSRGEDNLLFDDPLSPPGSTRPVGLLELPSSLRALLERTHLLVEKAYSSIDRSDLRVIHCDLWHDNIKLHQGSLHPFDFEDTVWGFRAHDIAMAMLDLLEVVGDERYAHLFAAFRHGYEAHLPWPDDPIQPFQVGRMLWKINWVATHQPEWLMSMLERYAPVLIHYEHNGSVICPADN